MNEKDILKLVESDKWMMTALEAVRSIHLPDWWIVAGFLRAKVWDHLHGYTRRTLPGDIDVVYYQPDRVVDRDHEAEVRLMAIAPAYPWEVFNQARMYTYNNHQPYLNTVDAFSRWAETVSTIGIRLNDDDLLELAAPHGIQDLVKMVIRPTPHPDANLEIFKQRLRTKGWIERWPMVRVSTRLY